MTENKYIRKKLPRNFGKSREWEKESTFSRMNTKEWKTKTDELLQKFEGENFRIEISYDSFLYSLSSEEQKDTQENSGVF